MGPFQIAIPPSEICRVYTSGILVMFHLRPTDLGSGSVSQSTAVAMEWSAERRLRMSENQMGSEY